MKKIIYSLVIMIAAGSLFTSCVENTEPQGIRDLREAKADYLASLSKLREADAEKVKAEAAVEQAKAAVAQAIANLAQVAVDAAKIAVDLEDAAVQAKIAEIKAQAEYDAVIAEHNLAIAEENLRAYLVKVEEQSKQLTKEEKEIVEAYTTAYKDVIAKEATVREKEKDLYNKTYNSYGEKSVEAAKAEYEQDKALAEQSKAYWETVLAANEELSDAEIASYDEWVKKYDALKAEIAGFAYDKAEIVKDSALNEYENKAVLDSFYAAIEAKHDAITKAGGKFTFKEFKSDLPVVSFKEGSVVETFVEYAKIKTVTISDDHKKITVAKAEGEAGQKVVKNVVDSLNLIIDALNREKVVVDQIVKDTTGIAALAAKTQHDYDSIKAVLVAGVDAFEPIAEAKEAAKTKEEDYEAANKTFGEDTTALIKSIKDFVAALNVYNNSKTWKAADSEKVFNAFVAVMVAREKALEYTPAKGATNKNYFKYFDYSITMQGSTPVAVPVKDSVKFSELEFAGIKKEGKYAGAKDGQGKFYYIDSPFQKILADAFGCDFFDENFGQEEYKEIKFADLIKTENTNYLEKTFYGNYWVNAVSGKDGKIYVTRGDVYVSETVQTAKKAWETAKGKIPEAIGNYYEKIYCNFWGLTPSAERPTDSLKINFTEKTYTDPYVLVTFSGKEGETVFNPAKDKKDASIDWKNVNYNDTSVALKAIETQLGQNNIKIKEKGIDYTLYAKTLAVAQFAAASVNYKENTEALAELTKIVKAVETAYNDAVSAASTGSAKADSLFLALTGKSKKDGGEIVDYTNKNVTKFISTDGKGTFKLAGEQKELAEKWLADYAKAYSELEAQKAEIDVTIDDNNKLAKIYGDYVEKLAELDKYTGSTPDDILKSVKGYWYGYDETYKWWGQTITVHIDGVLEQLQKNVDAAEEAIKVAEGKLAKLEAGYDQSQIDIESAQDELAKAQAELKEAEVKLAAAEEAYKAVLEAHGITE